MNAHPEDAWEAARHFDGASIPWVRLLFDLRTLPDKLSGHYNPQKDDPRLGVDQVVDSETGFIILEEIPSSEVVVGSIGQFWHLNIPFADVPAENFKSFCEPGWGKLAWAIRVEPYLHGSTISFELRTTATEDDAWKKLNRYFHIIGVASRLIRTSIMSHLEAELGKMRYPNHDLLHYPGDEVLPDAHHQLTYHTNIEAPISLVWRYIMQLGCDRAGWYSIDMLDHGGAPSIDHLVDGWETRQLGDKLAATPAKDSFYDVYAVHPEFDFVIGGATERMGGPFKMTWAFILQPIGEDATHLISRARMTAAPKLAEWLMGNIFYPPLHGLMSAIQLKNIKHIAERDALARNIAASPIKEVLEEEWEHDVNV
ncbi:MAG TPA: SRPBCC family protein [Candidatus Kapabacteria bacterium]|nr:SRPBCC family protein [Candidatus Kapabacteria bacterium]